jgi:hypothetical protein
LSPIWLSSCSCLVIVVSFAIENTVKQPFTCHQYDTQTVLVLLLLFVLLLKIRSWTNIVHLASTNCQMLFFQYQYKNKNNKTRTVWESPLEDIHVQLSIKNNDIIKFWPTIYFQINGWKNKWQTNGFVFRNITIDVHFYPFLEKCFLPYQVPIPSHRWFLGKFLRFLRIKKW